MAGSKVGNVSGFDSLPEAVKRRILSHTGLVLPRQDTGQPQGLIIADGRCRQQLPKSLFFVSREVSILARTILFSENRVILQGTHEAKCSWIKSQPKDLLQRVRRLDLIINFSPETKSRSPSWDELVSLIAERCLLDKLLLSVDAANEYDNLTEDTFEFEWLKDQYTSTMAPFEQRSKEFSKLQGFFVFWPKFASLEAKAEKAVMGNNYRAGRLGKIAYADPDWRLPHGWEWNKTDENGEESGDWLDYETKREWMQDQA